MKHTGIGKKGNMMTMRGYQQSIPSVLGSSDSPFHRSEHKSFLIKTLEEIRLLLQRLAMLNGF